MRSISFALTERQFLDGSKTVTRRLGWKNLKPGDLLCAVRKSMGLKKGESPVKLGVIRVVSVRREQLFRIEGDEMAKEGFPGYDPRAFVEMFERHMKCKWTDEVTRIEFERIESEAARG